MIKSSSIFGAAMFVMVLVASLSISPLCALCLPLFVGMGAGYLAGVFDKPDPEEALKRGAITGAIVGGIAVFAQVIAAVINAVVLQNSGFNPAILFGDTSPVAPLTIWGGQIAVACCVGLLNIGLMAGFGALGAVIWRNSAAKQQPVM
jgi:hypothetical protein